MGKIHFFPDFIQRICNGDFSLYGGDETRSFCYVEDCCEALEQLAVKAKSGSLYHVGSEDEVLIEDAANLIMKLMKKEGIYK